MRALVGAALVLITVAVALGGCYVVPAPPPVAPGVGPPPPPYVLARPECGWRYGSGCYGWGWYGAFC